MAAAEVLIADFPDTDTGRAAALPVTGGALEAVDTAGPGGVRLVVDLGHQVGEDRVRTKLEACGARRVEKFRR